tara:strand:- start:790 stop:1302 length:513 start_codon:yes stop_codon:yes gene_type:complete
MARYFNISGELTQQLLAPGDNVKVTGISLTNVQKVSKCKVDLYMEKQFEGKFYILKNIELPIGVTLEHDFSINNYTDEYGLYIKLTDGASFELTGDINPGNSTTTVPGTNTIFLSEVSVGDEIEVTGETKTVTSITADNSLVVDSTFSSALATDTTPTCNPTALVDVIIN